MKRIKEKIGVVLLFSFLIFQHIGLLASASLRIENDENKVDRFLRTDSLSTCLFPVGGGASDDRIFEAFLSQSPKDNPRLLLIPYAADEDKVGSSIEGAKKRFNRLGVQEVEVLDVSNLARAIRQVNKADVIWMGGGSQTKLRNTLADTGMELIHTIIDRYTSGQVIVGGTSAGAAIISEYMIRGVDPESGNALISQGLGLWSEVIIDQHFNERNRRGRLISAVLKHRDRIGIGIDEGTGVIYTNKKKIEAVGKGKVTTIRMVNGTLRINQIQAGDVLLLDEI